MNETTFSCITLRALLRLYQVPLCKQSDGSWSGRHPFSVRPGSALILSADGAAWSTNDTPPISGDRLDFIACMECVTRERAAELLHGTFPAILEREGIPTDDTPREPSAPTHPGRDRFRTTARHAVTQINIEATMWRMFNREGC